MSITELESRKLGATEYIKRHDGRVKELDRKSKAALRNIYLAEMGDANEILLMGGPQSHDELVNAIIEMEFPDIASVRETYVNLMVG